MRRLILSAMAAALLSGAGSAAPTVQQALGAKLPPSTTVIDEQNQQRRFAAISTGHPMLLVPVYFRCPNLCSLSLDYLARSIAALPAAAIADVEIVVLSIDSRDTPARARARRLALARRAPPGYSLANWQFLTAPPDSIRQILDILGIPFIYDTQSQEFNHPSIAVMLDAQGVIRQYVFGLDFPPVQLQQAAALARTQRSGSVVTRFLFACFHFDPRYSRYGRQISLGLRGCAACSLLGVASLLVWATRRRQRRSRGGLDPC